MDVIFKIVAGSRMYGTSNEKSDYDYRGIFLPEYNSYFGFKQKDIVETNSNIADIVYYSIKKFMKLAMACNPNIIEWLYVPGDNIIELKQPGIDLITMRFKLLNKRYIRDRFRGFSTSELYKFINNRKNTKSAMHCVRLLYEAIELLEHGTLTFPRPEASLLLDIKNNNMKHDDIIHKVKDLQVTLEDVYNRCDFLPDTSNTDHLEKKMIEIIKKYSRR